MKNIYLSSIFLYMTFFVLVSMEICLGQSLILRAGVNVANQRFTENGLLVSPFPEASNARINLSPRIGGNVGVLVDFPGKDGLSFETGVLLNSKGRDVEFDWTDTAYFRTTQQEVFIDVPLLLKYTTSGEDVRFFAGVGGYVGIGVWGWLLYDLRILDTAAQYYINDVYYVEDIQWGNRFGEPFKTNRFEYGSMISAGVEIGSFVASATYMHAWTAMYGHGGVNPRYVYSFALGYKFDVSSFLNTGVTKQ